MSGAPTIPTCLQSLFSEQQQRDSLNTSKSCSELAYSSLSPRGRKSFQHPGPSAFHPRLPTPWPHLLLPSLPLDSFLLSANMLGRPWLQRNALFPEIQQILFFHFLPPPLPTSPFHWGFRQTLHFKLQFLPPVLWHLSFWFLFFALLFCSQYFLFSNILHTLIISSLSSYGWEFYLYPST